MLTSEEKKQYLNNGLKCLQQGNFFNAHEDWEIPWKDMAGHVRSFWQAMIQLSVGAYHYENNNLTGCRNLWHKALKRCNEIIEQNLARDVQYVIELRKHLIECLRKVETGMNPLKDVERFSLEVVSESWFDFC